MTFGSFRGLELARPHEAFTYHTRISACPMNQVWPGYQRRLAQTEIASFAAWDMASPVDVVVASARPMQTAQVRPRSAGITPQIHGAILAEKAEHVAIVGRGILDGSTFDRRRSPPWSASTTAPMSASTASPCATPAASPSRRSPAVRCTSAM